MYNADYYKAIAADVAKVIRLIYKPENWAQGSMAKSSDGECLYDPFSPNAVRFCVVGAAYKTNCADKTIAWLETESIKCGYFDTTKLNDQNDHATVIKELLMFLRKLDRKTFNELKKELNIK